MSPALLRLSCTHLYESSITHDLNRVLIVSLCGDFNSRMRGVSHALRPFRTGRVTSPEAPSSGYRDATRVATRVSEAWVSSSVYRGVSESRLFKTHNWVTTSFPMEPRNAGLTPTALRVTSLYKRWCCVTRRRDACALGACCVTSISQSNRRKFESSLFWSESD